MDNGLRDCFTEHDNEFSSVSRISANVSPSVLLKQLIFLVGREPTATFISRRTTPLLPSDWNDNILSQMTNAKAFVLAGTFSVKVAFSWTSATEVFRYSLFVYIEDEKRLQRLVVTRCIVELSYRFMQTKEFNYKQSCITIRPSKFLVGE